MSIEYRTMVKADYPQLVALWELIPEIGVSYSDGEEEVARYLARNPGMSFVAEADGELVGAVLGGHDGRVGQLYHASVHPDLRHQGIASSLVKRAMEAISEAGIKRVHVALKDQHEKARSFWAKQGFEKQDAVRTMHRAVL